MLTIPKGMGWKTPMVAQVLVMSMVPRVSRMVPRVSRMLEGMPDEMGGHNHVILHPRKRRTRAPVLTGVRGRRPGVWLRRTGRDICAYIGGVISNSPRCLCVCLSYRTIMAVGLFKSKSSTHTFPPIFKHAQHAHAAPTLPLGDTPNTRALPLTLSLSVGRSRC